MLTNARRYVLRIDVTNHLGETSHIDYYNFKVDREFKDYPLLSLGGYEGDAG